MALAMISLLVKGQNIYNPSFDSVYYGGIDRIFEWVTSDGFQLGSGFSADTVFPLLPNTFYDATSLQYSEILDYGVYVDTTPFSPLCARLKSQPTVYRADGSTFETFVVNGTHFYTDSQGYIDFSRCGTPFTARPSGLKGFYRFSDLTTANNNFGRCEVLLKKYNPQTGTSDTVAYSKEELLFNPSATWKPFTVPLNYYSGDLPDTIVVIFHANMIENQPSVFRVDELSFEYSGIGWEEGQLNPMKCFPNPVGDELTIEYGEIRPDEIRIFDLKGTCIMSASFRQKINLSTLKSKAYMIELLRDHKTMSRMKILKL